MIDLAPLIGRATEPRPPRNIGPGNLAALEPYVYRLVTHLKHWSRVTGVSVAVVDPDRVLFARSFGFADRERGIPARPETLYRLASLSKPFTAAIVMRLVEDFDLDLDAPLERYLPGFSIRTRFAGGAPITVRTILAHRSGLPNLWRRPLPDGSPVPFNAMLPDIRSTYLVQPPGLLTKYSTLGYNLLGHMVEVVTGRPFADVARDELFAPLEAETASFAPDAKLLALLSRGHRRGVAAPTLPSLANEIPAGGLCASVLDLARFLRLFLGGGRIDGRQVLAPGSVATMLTPASPALPLDVEERMGLGWQLSTPPGLAGAGPIAAHGGAEFLFHSVAFLSLDHGIGIAVCSNSSEGRALVYRVATATIQAITGIARQGASAKRAAGPAPARPGALAAPRAGRYQTMAGIVDVDVGAHGRVELRLHGRRFRLVPEDHPFHSLRLLALGRIPLPLPISDLATLRLSGAEIEGRSVLIADADGQVRRLGELIAGPRPIPAAWQARAGDYMLTDSELAALLFAKAPNLRLGIEDGWLIARTHPAIHPAIELSWVLEPMSDSEAVFAGLANFLGGETISAIGSGASERICFSGYEFARIGS
jgi:CubicO group peptidase (beta-lactamase class C family)